MSTGRATSLRPSRGAGRGGEQRTGAQLSLLGGFELRAEDDYVRLPRTVQRLIAFLALQGRPLHRAYVAGRLWMDGSQEHAHGCLRTTLWRIPRMPEPLVAITSTHVALEERITVDVQGFEGTARRILRGGAPQPHDVERLAHAGDLLPDWYDDWILEERDHLAQLRLVALEAAGDRLVQAARYPEATVAALAAVHADPLRESAQRLLIRSYLGDGNVADAVRQFSAFRTQLGLRLGLEPSPQMLDLVRGIALAPV